MDSGILARAKPKASGKNKNVSLTTSVLARRGKREGARAGLGERSKARFCRFDKWKGSRTSLCLSASRGTFNFSTSGRRCGADAHSFHCSSVRAVKYERGHGRPEGASMQIVPQAFVGRPSHQRPPGHTLMRCSSRAACTTPSSWTGAARAPAHGNQSKHAMNAHLAPPYPLQQQQQQQQQQRRQREVRS